MLGRKKIPTKLKMIKGTHRKERDVVKEAFPDSNIPKPPKHLSKDALKEWNRVTVELRANGLITNLDRSLIAMYCQSWARLKKYEKIIAEKGELIKTPNGGINMSPAMWVLNKAADQVYKYASAFGMSPESRTKATTTKAKKKDNWEDFG